MLYIKGVYHDNGYLASDKEIEIIFRDGFDRNPKLCFKDCLDLLITNKLSFHSSLATMVELMSIYRKVVPTTVTECSNPWLDVILHFKLMHF